MDAYTHTIIATGAIGAAYALGRYIHNNTLHENVVGWVLDKLEKDGFVQTKTDKDGEKELIKISEIIAKHINGT
jgi:DNA-binding PadR family transcriptional regulator|tara:strand:+ start:454 stop:675 length:222 start_codon:yes stop_codon:yes gene_type:complete